MTEDNIEEQRRKFQAEEAQKGAFFKDRPLVARVTDSGSIQEARQSMRRIDALAAAIDTAVLARGTVGTGINAEYIEFDEWRKLSALFAKAKGEGMSNDNAAEAAGFMPLSAYATKFKQKPNGQWVPRAILQHEVGVRPGGAIVILKDKMPGDQHTIVVGASRKQ